MQEPIYRTMAAQIADILRHEIVENNVSEGMPLKEIELSKRFGVSRGPIREALKVLMREGLVTNRRSTGLQVADRPSESARALITEFRQRIESFIISELFIDLTASDFQNLDNILSSQLDACKQKDVAEVRKYDFAFHEYFVLRYNDKHLEEVWRSLVTRMLNRYNRHEQLIESYNEHENILKELKARNKSNVLTFLKHNIR